MKILVPSRPCTFAERLEIFKQVADLLGAKPEKGVTQGFTPEGINVELINADHNRFDSSVCVLGVKVWFWDARYWRDRMCYRRLLVKNGEIDTERLVSKLNEVRSIKCEADREIAAQLAIEENALSSNLSLANWSARGDFLLWNGARLFSLQEARQIQDLIDSFEGKQWSLTPSKGRANSSVYRIDLHRRLKPHLAFPPPLKRWRFPSSGGLHERAIGVHQNPLG